VSGHNTPTGQLDDDRTPERMEMPMDTSPMVRAGANDFHAAIEDAHVVALWEVYRGAAPEPHSEPAFHWPWRVIGPLMDRAVAEASMDEAERRVLSLANPAFGRDQSFRATTNLNAGLQILMPGENARPHRHTMDALRFVIEGTGAATVVNGKRCEMEPGDLILTPGWTWHEHEHNGKTRVVWLDSLDVPLVHDVGFPFFEPGPPKPFPALPSDSAFTAAGLVPAEPSSQPYSPLFRYPWSQAREALAATPPAEDGSRLLRYVNPATGGPVMARLDCYLLGLSAGKSTRRYRTTSNAVCLVVEGAGESTIGDTTVAWEKNDIFTLPHWNWISHTARTGSATIFQSTDRDVMRRLELLREEKG
jgi:gentisate 1,2-dioxygenase